MADVLGTFHDACIQNYHLDPAHFYTSPGLTWQGALKSTNFTLNLFTENNMYLMVERHIRGGLDINMKKEITL